MTAKTCTAIDILLKVAEEAQALVRGAFISHYTDTTHFECNELEEDDNDFYNNAYLYIAGKGVKRVLDYVGSTKQIVLDSAYPTLPVDLTPVVGDVVEIAYWRGNGLLKAQRAINQAIIASYRANEDCFYREVVVNAANDKDSLGATLADIVLDVDTFEYALPADCVFLSQIGVQPDSTQPERWFPRLDWWRTSGEEGALKIRFGKQALGFLRTFDGQQLYLHYEAREPVLSAFTSSDTTRLPLDYFSLAAEILRRRQINTDAAGDLQTDSMNLPQLQGEAAAALARVRALKKHLPRGPVYGFLAGE